MGSSSNKINKNGEQPDQFDVIVEGGGIMGSCTAYQTSKRGYSALLLDQFDMLHNRGSSHGESRTLRATYPEPCYTSMVLESSTLWEEAQSQIGYKVVIGSCGSHPSIEFRVLDHAQVAREFSGGVVVPEDWIGVVSGGAGVIKPTKAVCMFQTLAFHNGAILKDNVKVTDIRRDKGGCLVICSSTGEKFFARKCVITAGAWMKRLVKVVTGCEIPIDPLETTIWYWKIKGMKKITQ